jgi:hypothetical protein
MLKRSSVSIVAQLTELLTDELLFGALRARRRARARTSAHSTAREYPLTVLETRGQASEDPIL